MDNWVGHEKVRCEEMCFYFFARTIVRMSKYSVTHLMT